MRKKAAVVLFLALIVSTPAFAQESGVKTPVDHKNTISTAPVLDILGFVNIEYQRKVSESGTIGVSAGIFDLDDDSYQNVMFFGRYFPQGAAMTGFYFGGRVGVHHVTDDDDFFDDREESNSRFSIGVDIGYDWLLGRKRNVLIGLGVGGNRLLGNDNLGLEAYPTARLNIGFAF